LLYDRVVLRNGIVIEVLVEHSTVVAPLLTVVSHGEAEVEINAAKSGSETDYNCG
jgi:hypothetical protein